MHATPPAEPISLERNYRTCRSKGYLSDAIPETLE